MKKNISSISRALVIAAALALGISLFVPVWSIYLNAPQYPEGLRLQIWANNIAGDVDIINGLNHYIGMKTLHAKDFVEFTILPYIIGGYVLLFVIVAIAANRKLLNAAFFLFLLFGIVAMVDFWKWEYNYGHDLNPDAAIIVPGMAYQPPLIGFKQLLNFGAYSVPDIGGWLFVVAGVLLLTAMVMEIRSARRSKKLTVVAILLAVSASVSSCGKNGPQPIRLNKDACDFCKMFIADGRFMAEMVTSKGRVYKFDDIGCLLNYASALDANSIQTYYVSDFAKGGSFLDASTAWYIRDESLQSPMKGNTAAFQSKEAARQYADKYKVAAIDWKELGNLRQQQGDLHK